MREGREYRDIRERRGRAHSCRVSRLEPCSRATAAACVARSGRRRARRGRPQHQAPEPHPRLLDEPVKQERGGRGPDDRHRRQHDHETLLPGKPEEPPLVLLGQLYSYVIAFTHPRPKSLKKSHLKTSQPRFQEALHEAHLISKPGKI